MIPKQEQVQLDQLNKSLEALFNQLENYPSEKLNKQPDAGTWSPLMVVKHIMLAEAYAAQYVRKKLGFDPEIGKAGFMAGLRAWVLDLYFKSPIKRKAPEVIADKALIGPHQLKALRQQWLQQRWELQQLLESIPEERYTEEVYKHPFVGRLSMNGMLRFFQGHFDRHRRQIEIRCMSV